MAHSNSILGTLVLPFRWHRHPISKQIVFSKPFARTLFVCAIWNALHKDSLSYSHQILCYELRDIENTAVHLGHVVCNLILTKHYENIAKSQPKLIISIEVEAISIPFVILNHLHFRKTSPQTVSFVFNSITYSRTTLRYNCEYVIYCCHLLIAIQRENLGIKLICFPSLKKQIYKMKYLLLYFDIV